MWSFAKMASTGEDVGKYVEQFRQIYENNKHWEARKTFLLKNWGDYPENQLISMSRVWANMEFDGCQYDPELMERVRELAAGIQIGEVTSDSFAKRHQPAAMRGDQQPGSVGGQQSAMLQQTSTPSTQGNGLLGTAPPGISPQQIGEMAENTRKAIFSQNDRRDASRGGGPNKKKRVKGPGEDDHSEAMEIVREFAHRLEYLLRRPQVTLTQPWCILNNAAQKMSKKSLMFEQYTDYEEYQDEAGETKTRRCGGWQMRSFLDDTMLIEHTGVEGELQRVVKNTAGELLINRCLNPRTLSLDYHEEKTSPKGKVYTSTVVETPLPWLKDEVRDYKEVYGEKNEQTQTRVVPVQNVTYDPKDPFSTFILLEASDKIPDGWRDMQTLNNSAANPSNKGCKLDIVVSDTKLPVDGKEVWLAKVLLNDTLIGFGTHEDQKKVRHVAAKVAVDCLRKKCVAVKNNRDFEIDQEAAIPVQNISSKKDSGSSLFDLPSSSSKAIESDNVGHKLLKQMGWTGQGGLGKDGFGISQPIIPIEHIRGEGLGYSDGGQLNRRTVEKIMEQYIASGSSDPLVFPACLDRDERKVIHGLAHKLNLKSRSYGPKEGKDRYLLVTLKRSLHQVIREGVQSGGNVMGYEVQLPGAAQ